MPAKLIGVMIFASLFSPNSPVTTSPINSTFQDYADCVAARDVMRSKGRVKVEDRELGYRTMVECYPDGDTPPAAPKRIVPPTGYDIIPAPGRGPNIRVPEQYGAGGPVPLSGPYPWPQDH